MIEMLVVFAIMALMLALSAGTYVSIERSNKAQAAVSAFDVALRQARNAAVSANAPAFVVIDDHRIVPWVYKTVGLWHFEDRDSYGRSSGAFHEAVMRGAELVNEGKIGKAAKLNPKSWIDVGSSPDFDLEDGGFLEIYVRSGVHKFSSEQFIFQKQGAYSFSVGAGGVLSGNAGNHTLKTPTYRLTPGRWTKLAFAWDRLATRIFADDAVVAIGPGSAPALSDHPLLIGHSESGSFIGLVDEARVMTVSAGREVPIPLQCTVTSNLAPWSAVYFDSDGSLDMRYHAGPLSVTFTQNGKARSVNISMLGQTVRTEVVDVKSETEERADEPLTAVKPFKPGKEDNR